jgi:hypothetical protein
MKRSIPRKERPKLHCLVESRDVHVPVCWSDEQIVAVRAKWPDGIDIAVLAAPGYEGMGSARERAWLVAVARAHFAKLSDPDEKSGTREALEALTFPTIDGVLEHEHTNDNTSTESASSSSVLELVSSQPVPPTNVDE